MTTRLIPSLILLSLPCFAQLSTPPVAVEGSVTDEATGVALANVKVHLQLPVGQHETKTNDEGRYEFRGAFSGPIRIGTSQENDYTATSRLIHVSSEATSAAKVDLRVRKGAAIGGRVVSASKAPVAGAYVHVTREGFRNGRPALQTYVSRITNSAGEFRIPYLQPGPYFILVTPPPLEFSERPVSGGADTAEPEPKLSDAPTYYPSSLTREGRVPIAVTAGEIRDNIDIVMLQARGVCVSTTLVTLPAIPSGEWRSIVLVDASPMSQIKIAFGRSRNSERMEVCGITPGSYRLTTATKDTSGKYFMAFQPVSVSGSRSVRLPDSYLQESRPLTGRVVLHHDNGASEEERKRTPPSISIGLEPKDRLTWTGEVLNAKSSADGSFVIPSTLNDQYWTKVEAIPPGYYLKSVTSAGNEAYAKPLQAWGDELVIALARNGASLSGTVNDRDHRPIPNATVLLVLDPLVLPWAPNQVTTRTTDPSGRYQFNDVVPGAYVVAAFLGISRGDEHSPEVIRAAAQSSTRVRLDPGSAKNANLAVQLFP